MSRLKGKMINYLRKLTYKKINPMPSFPFLSQLTFIRLRVIFEAIDEVIFHNYKGYLYHAGLSEALRDEVCNRKNKDCQDCNRRYDCFYFSLFECTTRPDHPHVQKYPKSPHPYIISPIPDEKTAYKKGDRFGFELTIIGNMDEQLPLLYNVFWQMGKRGIGVNRGRYKPVDIQLSDVRQEEDNIPLGVENKVKLTFETPLQLGKDKFVLENLPPFELLMNRMALRFSLLSHFQFGSDYFEPEYRINGITLSPDSDAKYVNWGNFKKGTLKFDGLVGNIIYEGEGLQNWLPLLIPGTQLQVGSKTAFGLGKYCIESIEQ